LGNSYRDIQGNIVGDADTLISKLARIKALVFDWDGVFNNGDKGHAPSTFNEIDSMGINMLRFGYYLLNKVNPYAFIVTGERNETALRWAEREHFHAVYLKAKNKIDVLHQLEKQYEINREEILFVFDDIHDLSLARECGVKILIPNQGAQKFAGFCREMNYCDYITKYSGGQHALREISETVLSLLGLFENTVKLRVDFEGLYFEYWQTRNKVGTKVLELSYGEDGKSSPTIRNDESDPEH
jgi:3-deoxy-D-manno-octulosonate 8-phosphate phosphatase (KDO 8-P phosphatase)